MAGYTREIYQINQSTGQRRYAGYAKFDSNDKYLGSFGGYNSEGKLSEWGDTKSAGKNSSKSGVSAMQNIIKMSGLNQSKRTKLAFNYQLL